MQNPDYIAELKVEIDQIPNESMRLCMRDYLQAREQNRDILLEVPEDLLDYKIASGEEVQSLRENFAELACVEASLVEGLRSGRRLRGGGDYILPKHPTKEQILEAYQKVDRELFDVLKNSAFDPKDSIIYVGETAQEQTFRKGGSVWYFFYHEMKELGSIRAKLDGVGIKPPESYKKAWG